ncbi:hypothetical protein [Nocardia brasiliensis]
MDEDLNHRGYQAAQLPQSDHASVGEERESISSVGRRLTQRPSTGRSRPGSTTDVASPRFAGIVGGESLSARMGFSIR